VARLWGRLFMSGQHVRLLADRMHVSRFGRIEETRIEEPLMLRLSFGGAKARASHVSKGSCKQRPGGAPILREGKSFAGAVQAATALREKSRVATPLNASEGTYLGRLTTLPPWGNVSPSVARRADGTVCVIVGMTSALT